MRTGFRILPIALFSVVLGGVAIAGWLPESLVLERRVEVEAPPAAVLERLVAIERWRGWYLPPGEGRVEGPARGAGGALVLEDPEAGELRRIVLTETSSAGVAYRFPEKDQTPFDIEGRFSVEAGPPGTSRVTSRQSLRARSTAWMARAGERWFLSLLADRLIGSVLERELENLKRAVENQ